MADNVDTPESRELDDSRGVSPGGNSDSTNANNTNKLSAVKDRACPFCHQPFTSSSLGRHLDTYIRPKNPKAPDGIHDVAEIRNIRGNITRRHARNSSAIDHSSKRSSSEVQQRPLPNGAAPLQPVQPSVQPQPPMHHTYMNDNSHSVFRTKADWTATGVINNLPPRSSATPNSRDLPFPRPDFQPDRQLIEETDEKEHSRATELALKEVLSSVQDAVSRAQKPPVFDFDPLTLNFPALCLRVLSPPTTLFSTIPSTTEHSWPLGVPLHPCYDQLRSTVAERVKHHQRSWWSTPSMSVGSMGKMTDPETQDSRNEFPRELQTYLDHIDNTYSHWTQLPETRKQEVWDLELMRAYADELRQNKTLDQQLDDAYREVRHLRAQMDALNRQQPWQRSRSPQTNLPNLTPALLPKNVARQLIDSNIDLREWDFDRLVTKWKHSIRPRRNWAWTNAPPPPSTGVQDTGPRSASGTYGRGYPPTTENISNQSKTLPSPYSSAPNVVEPLPPKLSSIESPVATSTEHQDRTIGSDVEMKDQEPTQSRRSRRMFAREGTG